MHKILNCIICAFIYFCEGLYEELLRSIARVLVAHVRNCRKQQQLCPQRSFAVGCAWTCCRRLSLCRFTIFASFLQALESDGQMQTRSSQPPPPPPTPTPTTNPPPPPSFVSFLTCRTSCCRSPHYRWSPASASPGPLGHMLGPCAATGTRIAAPG
jgi:hypothetical protein